MFQIFMFMYVKIELPSSLKYYKVRQAHDLIEFFRTKKATDKWSVKDMLQVISIASGVSVADLRRVDIAQIKEAYAMVGKAINVPRKEPAPEVTINGVVYAFDKNMGKSWHGGRFIDAENAGTDMAEFPEKFAAICYLEKGKEYDDTTVEDRAEIFRDHFPGDLYVDLTAFFLQKFEKLAPGFSVLQIARSQLATQKALRMLKETPKGG